MKKLNFKTRNSQKGITLVALVITIIILLILAGIAIASLTGDNGLFKRAQQARQETEEAQDMEKIRLAVLEAQIGDNGYQEIDATTFQEALNSQFEGRNLQATDNKDGSFTVNLDNMSKMYYVDSDGEIINSINMIAIGTADELKAFRDDVNSGNSYEGKYVYLTDNITLDINEEWEPIGLYLNKNSSPDDTTNTPFSGIFDGKGYEVNGVYINTTIKAQGLFGLVNNGVIKNVGIGEGIINGGVTTGGIVGYAYDNTKIINCYNNAAITSSSYYAGGIAGYAKVNVSIENSYNVGTITSEYNVGGICGEIDNSEIKNCYNRGNINATNTGGSSTYAGGISSQAVNSSIINCYSIGTITTYNSYRVAGIVGYLSDTSNIKNNYFLENTVNGVNGTNIEGADVKTEEELKKIYTLLGEVFKEDADNINNGYPILQWQKKNY